MYLVHEQPLNALKQPEEHPNYRIDAQLPDDARFETRAIRTQTPRARREHSTPLYMTSSFVFGDAEQARALFAEEEQGEIYSRFVNPSVAEFEAKIAALEGTEAAYATATGMAANFATFASFLQQGDHMVASRAVFGSTFNLLTKFLPKWGIEVSLVDLDANDQWAAAIRPETKMLFVETPSNPSLRLADLTFLGELAREHGLLYAVDNCFATPYLQQPAKFGANLIIHSATKFIDGQGRTLGGAIAGPAELIDPVYRFCRNTGPSLSPFNAWVLSKSLETLHVRMEAHCRNAEHIARTLEEHPALHNLRYPFLESHPQVALARQQMKHGGGILTFEVRGGYEKGKAFLEGLKMLSHTANLGDTRTICTHPASTTHSKLSPEEQQAVGIQPGLIRLSVGLEHPEDVLNDIRQSLERV